MGGDWSCSGGGGGTEQNASGAYNGGGNCKDPFCPQPWGGVGRGPTRAKTPSLRPYFCSAPPPPPPSRAQHVALAGWGPPLPKRDQLGVGGGTATVAPSPDTKQLPHARSMHSHPPSPRPKWGQQISGGGDPIENIRPPPPPIPILRAHCQPRATEGILCPHPTAMGCSGGGNAGGTVAGLGGSGAKGGGGALTGLPPVQKQRHRINRGTGMGGGGEGGSRGGGVGAQTGAPNCSPTPQQRPSPASSSPGYPTSVCLCVSVCPPSAPWCSVDVIVDAGGVGGGRFGLLLLAGAQPRGAAHQPQVGLLLLGLTGLGVVGTGFGRG